MSKRITVDPVTRIEGHLRIDCEVDGKVQKAWSSARCSAGSRRSLLGRDPRDAWMFTALLRRLHDRARDRLGAHRGERRSASDPINAQYIRNLIVMAHAMPTIVHFYHLSALDWVGCRLALKADPTKALDSRREPLAVARQQQDAAQGVQDKVKGFVEAGQLGIFTNGYWGHPP
jgi:hydrogenase large subunit